MKQVTRIQNDSSGPTCASRRASRLRSVGATSTTQLTTTVCHHRIWLRQRQRFALRDALVLHLLHTICIYIQVKTAFGQLAVGDYIYKVATPVCLVSEGEWGTKYTK